ncbi:MAG: hypothetical protein UW12_C0026G0001, partial [Parcubacteria group bacterium GW2011_GWF1_43_9]
MARKKEEEPRPKNQAKPGLAPYTKHGLAVVFL